MGSSSFDFGDEVVVVTGGSSGIGRAAALRFGAAGATVIVADVRREPKDVNAEQPTDEVIADRGESAEFVETDVSDPDDVESVVAAAREFGGVDVMVNNAGIVIGGSITELSLDDLRTMIGVNVEGVFLGTQAGARDMLDRNEPGVIVNTASISSSLAQHGQVGYDATKGAVRMLTRGAALELAETGIRVNAVAPGQIATEITAGWTETATEAANGEDGGDSDGGDSDGGDSDGGGDSDEGDSDDEDEFLKDVPLGRAGTPEDVAPAICYLASDGADYVTGELLHVDGGWQIC